MASLVIIDDTLEFVINVAKIIMVKKDGSTVIVNVEDYSISETTDDISIESGVVNTVPKGAISMAFGALHNHGY